MPEPLGPGESAEKAVTELPHAVTPPLYTEFVASAGDRLLVHGEIFDVPMIQLQYPVEVPVYAPEYLSGQYRIRLEASVLQLTTRTDRYSYFDASPRYYSVSHGGVWSEPRTGDRVGIRRPHGVGCDEWFLFLRSWGRSRESAVSFSVPVSVQDSSLFHDGIAQITDPNGEWRRLVFAGFFDGKVHFELEETHGPDSHVTRNFQFNLNQDDSSTLIGIRDYRLEILSADTVQMKYRWLALE